MTTDADAAVASGGMTAPAEPSLRSGLAVSVVDQGLLSLASLAAGLIVIRTAAKADYGLYMLATAAILYGVGIQNALVTTPMTVLAPGREEGERGRFCAALAAGGFLVLLPLIAAGLAAVWAMGMLGILSVNDGLLAASVLVALPGVLLREFCRGLFFQRFDPVAVLKIDVLHILLFFAGLAAAVAFLPERVHVAAIFLAGVASLLSGGIGLVAARIGPLPRPGEIRAALAESWRHGRWALGGVTITWLQDQSYVYLLALVAGPAMTAEAGAARLFLAPVALLAAGFGRTLLPRWAMWGQRGEVELVRLQAGKVTAALVAVVAAVTAVAVLAAESASGLLGREYEAVGLLVVLWGGMFAAQTVRSVRSWVLQAACRFREITAANAVSALVALLAGGAFVIRFGAAGSIVALTVGEIVLASLLWRASADVR